MIDWWRLQSLFQKNPFFSDCHYMDRLASAVSTTGPVCIDLIQSQLLLDNVEYRERHLIACGRRTTCVLEFIFQTYTVFPEKGTRRNSRRTGEFLRGKEQVKYLWQTRNIPINCNTIIVFCRHIPSGAILTSRLCGGSRIVTSSFFKKPTKSSACCPCLRGIIEQSGPHPVTACQHNQPWASSFISVLHSTPRHNVPYLFLLYPLLWLM